MKVWRICVMTLVWCLNIQAFSLASDTTKMDMQAIDPSVQMKNLESYYITSGRTYDKIVALLQSIPADKTGLAGDYYFRIDKNVTSKYFYHVNVYDKTMHTLKSSYFVAKDESCVWRLYGGKDAELIFGNTESMLKKTEVIVYPKRIPIGSYGIIRVHVPGMIPYDIKATSLNAYVATISDKMNIVPAVVGTTSIVVDIKIGNAERTFTKDIAVVDTADTRDEYRRSPNVSVGIGVGWHHHGGIGIGVGPWW